MPAGFDGLIYYIVFNYSWLYCNKNHLCLILLPLEDHLRLTLLIAPRGSAGDFLEMLISTGLVWFSLLFPCLSPEGCLTRPGEGSSNTGGDDGDGLRVFSLPLPEKDAILQHRPHKPSQAWRSCKGLCAICFSHADLRSTA